MYRERKKLKKGAVGDIIKVLWRHAKFYPVLMGLILLSVVIVDASQIIVPLYYKRMVDEISRVGIANSNIMAELFSIFAIVAGLRILGWAGRRTRGFLVVAFESRVMMSLSQTSFDYLLRHSYKFFTDNFAGSLVRKVNRLTRSFEMIMDQLIFSLFPLVIILTGILFVLFRRDVRLGLVMAAGIILFLSFQIISARWRQKYEVQRSEKDSEATGALADAIGNASTIKLFSGYAHESGIFARALNNLLKATLKAWNLGEATDAIQSVMTLSMEIAMIYMAIILWGKGILTPGDFILIQAYLINVFDRIFDFGRALRKLFEAFADSSEMVDILNEPHEVRDVRGAKELQAKKVKIEFKEVDFSFNKTRKVLNQFSLVIEPGEKVAFVGSSGAGKTTITRLLTRFHDIQGGKILIDGQDIAKVTQESLWHAIALVPQEPVLFHRTLKENILYGRRDAADEEVFEAAKRAHCHEFISALPSGYDTYVGERGVKLSGGERQRVAIARAILKNAPILVLDEATSSLDSESEAFIQDALRDLMQGRTVIAIAHRLSTVRQMDRIIVIDDGKITAMGTHEELLHTRGAYQKLWKIQAGKFV